MMFIVLLPLFLLFISSSLDAYSIDYEFDKPQQQKQHRHRQDNVLSAIRRHYDGIDNSTPVIRNPIGTEMGMFGPPGF